LAEAANALDETCSQEDLKRSMRQAALDIPDKTAEDSDEESDYEWDDSLRWTTPRTNVKGHIGTLKISLSGASNLKPGSGSPSVSPYVFISVGGQRFRTPTVRQNCNPEWNTTFCFVVRNDHVNSDIDFSISDDDPDARARGMVDRSLGQLCFPLQRAMQSSPLSLQDATLTGIPEGAISVRLEYVPVDMTKHKCAVDAPVLDS